MRFLDLLFRRTTPPEAQRSVKTARLDELEAVVDSEVRSGQRALDDKNRLAKSVDDAARALRNQRGPW